MPHQSAKQSDSSANLRKSQDAGSDIENTNHGKLIKDTPQEGRQKRGPFSACLNWIVPSGSIRSSTFNLAACLVGSGILGLPAAFNTSGIIMATIYIILIAAETGYSIRLLAITAEKTGLRTYEEMAGILLHSKARYLSVTARSLNALGASVSYVITIGDLLRPVLNAINSTPKFLLEPTGFKLLHTVLFFVFVFPLIFPRTFNALRHISLVAMAFILFFSVCIVVHSCTYGLGKNPPPQLKLFTTGNESLQGLGVFIFAFLCQFNAVDIYKEMKKPSVNRYTLAAFFAMLFSGIFLFSVGLFGYLEFGESVTGSILLHYDPIASPQFLVSYFGIFLKVCSSFALLLASGRRSLFSLFDWEPITVTWWKHALFSIIFALIAFFLGLFIPNVTMVFGLTGGVCGGFIGFILPALFRMYAGNWSLKTVGILNYVSTYLMLIAGVVAVVFATVTTIYSALPKNNN